MPLPVFKSARPARLFPLVRFRRRVFAAFCALLCSFVVAEEASAQLQTGDFCGLESEFEITSRDGKLTLEKGDTVEILQILKNSVEVKAGSTKGLANKKKLQKNCALFWAFCALKSPIKLYPRKQKRKPINKRRGRFVVETREKSWSRVRDDKGLFFARTPDLVQHCIFSKGPRPTPYRAQWPRRDMRKKNIVVLPFAVRGVSDSEVKLVERTFSKAFLKSRKDAVGIPRKSISETQRSSSLKRVIEAVKVDTNANARFAVVGLVKPGKGRSWSVTIALVDVEEEKVLKAAKSTAKRNSSKWAKKVARLVAKVLPKASLIPAFQPKIPLPDEKVEELVNAPSEKLALAATTPSEVDTSSVRDASTDGKTAPPLEPTEKVENSSVAQVEKKPAAAETLSSASEDSTKAPQSNLTTTHGSQKDVSCDCKEQALPPAVSQVRIEERIIRQKRPFYLNTLAGGSFGAAAGFLVAGTTLGTLSLLDMFAVNDMKHSHPDRNATIVAMQQKSAVADVFFVASVVGITAGTVFLLLGVDVDGVQGE